jgi:hypothetical protein
VMIPLATLSSVSLKSSCIQVYAGKHDNMNA